MLTTDISLIGHELNSALDASLKKNNTSRFFWILYMINELILNMRWSFSGDNCTKLSRDPRNDIAKIKRLVKMAKSAVVSCHFPSYYRVFCNFFTESFACPRGHYATPTFLSQSHRPFHPLSDDVA